MIIENLFVDQRAVTSRKNSDSFGHSLKYFLDMQNFDGLTALHYATFMGNIEIIKYLTMKGAKPLIKDKDGQNVIHIAAQKGYVAIIYYFLENFSFDINEKDCQFSTALHWAAYLDEEITMAYLLAWGADINASDKVGNTPLHLSVVSSEYAKSTRCTKLLLLRGARRDTRNNNGHRPIDLVKTSSVEGDLRSMLKNPKYCSCLMLKLPPTKVTKSPSTAIFFVFLLVALLIGFFLFVFPFIDKSLTILLIIFLIFTVILIIFFILATFTDPGYLNTDETINFQELLLTVGAEKI